jgi:asparagine synthase (glutamine-hydrolysing)
MALFVLSTRDPDHAGQMELAARAQFARHGLPAVTTLELDGWRALHAAPRLGGPDTLLTRGDDLVAVAGMPIVDGLIGRAALERLLEPGVVPDIDGRRIEGQFVALVRRAGRTFLFGDYFGAFQLFHDTGERFFTPSQLAAIDALPRVSFDPQGLYEWVFGVVSMGVDSVFAELKLLGSERFVELTPTGAVSHPLRRPVFDWTVPDISDEERVSRNRDRLMAVAEAHVRAFGDEINCPLSAGTDSRLMLSALRAAGCTPRVYVYGPPGGADVRIAQAVGAAEGFPVEWIDKQSDPIAPEAFPEQVERNFHDVDALPNFGNLFDNGVNAAARDKRHAGGSLAVSGGAGEIYRDFFMMPDRPASAWTLARSYSSRFLPSDARAPFDAVTYRRNIADKLAAGLGASDRDEPLARTRIEQALPRVRVPALFRWEMTAESRHGPYVLMFIQPSLVAEAERVPMHLKRNGRFQAMMIRAIDPALARHLSGYGYDYVSGPNLRYRLEEAATRYRPAWLRERTYAIKRRRGAMNDEHGGLLSADYAGRVVDMDLPIMRRWFDVDVINDAGLWRRLACLEYLAQRLGSRLAA